MLCAHAAAVVCFCQASPEKSFKPLVLCAGTRGGCMPCGATFGAQIKRLLCHSSDRRSCKASLCASCSHCAVTACATLYSYCTVVWQAKAFRHSSCSFAHLVSYSFSHAFAYDVVQCQHLPCSVMTCCPSGCCRDMLHIFATCEWPALAANRQNYHCKAYWYLRLQAHYPNPRHA